MFKKVSILFMALSLFILSGCGVNIKQEGNKIFTDISKDEAYQFSNAAVKTKGYKVKESSRINYYIEATPEYNKTLDIENAQNKELRIDIADGNKSNETVVTVLAKLNGKIDEEESNSVAEAAVKEIITELDKYGKFNLSEKGQYTYHVATPEQVFDYAAKYFDNNNNVQITEKLAKEGSLKLKENTSTSVFNDPLLAAVKVLSDETGKVTVMLDTLLKGNYDIKGNQAYSIRFVDDFINYLENYPIIEKGLRYPFKYLSFEQAFQNSLAALKEGGYLISEADNKNYLITAQKNNINVSATFTEINYNMAVNLEAFAESTDLDVNKEQLSEEIQQELNTLRDLLVKYQTIYTSTKLFTSTNQNDVIKQTQATLTALGFKSSTNRNDLTIRAVSLKDSNLVHFIVINNLGTDGISLEINTMYNTKLITAAALVERENNRLLDALAKYDKTDLK